MPKYLLFALLGPFSRYWLDVMVAGSGTLGDPEYDPPKTWDGGEFVQDLDMAISRIENADLPDVPYQVFGQTPQYHGGEGPYFPGPAGTMQAPFSTEGSVKIDVEAIDFQVDEVFVLEYGLPASGWLHDQVRNYFTNRICLHELGHVFGINHHTPYPPGLAGSYYCVMKYDAVSDWPTNPFSWTTYVWGRGYLADEWNCAGEKNLRPCP